ncbi:MAG: hypothetical protein LBC03_06615 [Nitrososphaerota archaeon]|jgi:hypothetical protein|nr:hypothetical protein [Nitrososphaerota archaeon]
MSWKDYEKNTAKKHNGKHVGGPGKPDYVRGKVRGEVKHRKTPVTKPELRSFRKKGVTEVHSLSGFTKPAIGHAKKHNMKVKLFRRGRQVN